LYGTGEEMVYPNEDKVKTKLATQKELGKWFWYMAKVGMFIYLSPGEEERRRIQILHSQFKKDVFRARLRGRPLTDDQMKEHFSRLNEILEDGKKKGEERERENNILGLKSKSYNP
jgi:benzoyl-CoA reductase/2-hydroxyglutaryl-CoA dehydratase subunit BcrC/BadD/HgdB